MEGAKAGAGDLLLGWWVGVASGCLVTATTGGGGGMGSEASWQDWTFTEPRLRAKEAGEDGEGRS